MAQINLILSNELRNTFKAYCAAQGRTMRDMLLEMIEQKIKEAMRKK